MIFNIKEGRFIEKENVKKIQYEDYDVYYNGLIRFPEEKDIGRVNLW